jgi:limonene-1,2-epoxide hydrolase
MIHPTLPPSPSAAPSPDVSTHAGQPEPIAQLVQFFESMSPSDAQRMDRIYAPDAWFKDPFNEVRGVRDISRIFAHMFEQVDAPRFVVTEALVQGSSVMLTWDFNFSFKPPLRAGLQCIRGCSHLRLDADGRVVFHRDYWDTAEELYEKMPVLGGLMRWLRRRASLPPL